MKRTTLFSALFFTLATTTSAQSWLDITNSYIDDPNFMRSNYNGWTLDSWWVGSTATRAGCQEFWNGIWDFYRTVTVPTPGRYRVSVNGYYRPGDFSNEDWQAHEDGSEQILCMLYANDNATPMSSIYAHYFEQRWGDCWSHVTTLGPGQRTYQFYPNAMESGAQMLHQGLHQNVVETVVGSDRRLTFGIRVDFDGYENSNWVLFTGWKLEWQGTETPVTAININPSELTLTEGEQRQLDVTVAPDDATFKDVAYTSSNTAVATVDADGMVTAKTSGTTTITVRTVSGNSNVTAQCQVTVKRNEVTAGSLIINEIQAANIDQFIDPSFNFGGWVELYNPTSSAVSLTGIVVTDNKGNRMRLDARFGAIPAKGYKNVWFDHYTAWSPQMVSFKLDADGGTITFAKDNGTVLATQQYPAAVARTSYARTADNGTTWGITDQPTPEATNATSAFATTRLTPPVFSHPGGLIRSGSVNLRITYPNGSTLRYTTDGSTPTLVNGETSSDGRFNISETTVIRARVFKQGMLASQVVTQSYIFPDYDYSLPIISIVTDEDGIFGDDYGIFVQGNGNGRAGNGQDAKCNWNMEWDRPVNMEFIEADGTNVFNQELAIESAGGWSRAWSPHSFNIKANKVFEGQNRMEYQFFPEEPFLRHKALKVRNGGNDTSCRIKDAAIQEVVRTSGLYAETQGYRPVHVLINGQFYNTLNLREPNNRNYAFAHYGIDTDEQDQWKMSPDSGYVQQVGTKESWDKLIQQSAFAESPSFYVPIQKVLDIENYINYMSIMLYIGGEDWPQNNIKGFKAWQDGKFRFVIFDTDGAFSTTSPFTSFANKQTYTFDHLRGAEERYPYGTCLTREIEFVTLFLNLLKNRDFKKQFIDQFCIVAGSVFEPSRSREVIDRLVAAVEPARDLDWGSAVSTANQVKNALSSSRQSTLVNAMRNYLGLDAPLTARISSNVEGAALRLNGLPIPTGQFIGRVFAPARITATPPPGYRFVGWASNQAAAGRTLFAKGNEWSYYDNGSLDGQSWTSASYATSTWKSGRAPLGYDTGNAEKNQAYATTLSYGNDSGNKHPTYYFRKTVSLTTAPSADDVFTLDWTADDGFVVYVNGTEAGRYLMDNTPAPTFSSLADSYAPANPESGQMRLAANLFQKGNNVIAVELHNNSVSSTDIYWDAALTLQQTASGGGNIISDQPNYDITANNTVITATFEPLSAQELAQSDARPIKINEVSAANDIFVNDLYKKNDWIELYNTTTQDIDVAGIYLSDKADQPEKFRIPSSNGTFTTIVPAHGHLIVWADKLQGTSQLHADFKLASEEGEVVITAADKSWADTLQYCGHTGLQSVGLYPDGGTEVYVMEHPTIGAANIVTLADKTWKEPVPTTVDAVETVADEAGDDAIYDLSGRRRGRGDDLHRLPSGVYVSGGRKVLK
jgi:hypothetical protein